MPLCGVYPCEMRVVNILLREWGHRLGTCTRPFGQQGFALKIHGNPISVAVSASTVSKTIVGVGKHGAPIQYTRGEIVECARLCSHPTHHYATRLMLRLWREVCAPLWPYWQARAAVSYSQNAHHSGDIYRFDGWERIKTDCGSMGGGTWSRKRSASEAVHGQKSLWLWRYP